MRPEEVRELLLTMQDTEYRDFMSGVIPTVPKDQVIGIRTPLLRKAAKELYRSGGAGAFLKDLPHRYFEEDQLHAFVISEIRDMGLCLAETEAFLPFVGNWATCDQLSPAVFAKHKDELLPRIRDWLRSGRTYTVRFGVDMLMRHFLDDRFEPSQPALLIPNAGDDYYVNMAIAWYFATALAKQYGSVIGYLEEGRLPVWVHNKAIQKAVESRRITDDQKAYLRTLKRHE